MTYEVLARKWRPKQFDDVVGQDHVTQTLKNAIKTNRIAHAYLFVGPRGIGKTSIARIFAKALNCERGASVTPCDKCDSCREIAAGNSLDVLEIDGASNNGVEQVRDLRETVKYAPSKSAYKIYIIDEVHMLSTAAFNALLKTLEEPPRHVKFMFATTEAEKILPTIVSRCQRFDLRRIPAPMIVERLGLVAGDENVKVSDDALLAIARGAEGGLRDAESALDQLISFKGNEIVEDDVLSIFGLVSRGVLEELGDKILRGDIKSVIKIVCRLDEAGKDLQRLILELMEHFRNLLVCLHVGGGCAELELTEAQVAVLKKQAELTNTARILRITDILSETENRMRFALSRRALLETALIRCARAAVVVSLEEILAQINDLRRNLTGHERDAEEGRALRNTVAQSAPPDPRPEGFGEELAMLRERWREIIEKVGKIALTAKSALVDARPTSVGSDHVIIAFDPEFGDEMRNLDSGAGRHAIEHVLANMLKRSIRANFVLGDEDTTPKESVNHAERSVDEPEPAPDELAASPDEAAGGRDARTRKTKTEKSKSGKKWEEDPAVRDALDVFKARIVDVRE